MNQLLGHWQCERGGRAEVYQTKKRGGHFYTRCDCCGLMQGTGAGRQQDIYDKAEFLPGSAVVKPSNVGEKQKAIEHDGESEAPKAMGAGDWVPSDEQEKEPSQEKKSGGVLVPMLMAIAALGVGAWLS